MKNEFLKMSLKSLHILENGDIFVVDPLISLNLDIVTFAKKLCAFYPILANSHPKILHF